MNGTMQTSALPPQTSAFQPGAPTPQRARAFAQARRHTGRVRFFRVALVAAGVLGVSGLAVWSFLDPFRILPAGVTISRAGLSGTRVTMELPKLAGFRKDGRAYAVSADSSVQDIKNPTIIELTGVTAKIAMADKSSAEVRAPLGTYDTKLEQMLFSGDVRVKSDSGYDLAMKSARVEFKGSTLSTKDPVVLTMKTGTVNADAMEVTDNGQKISFEGHVITVMKPADDKAGADSLKGANQ